MNPTLIALALTVPTAHGATPKKVGINCSSRMRSKSAADTANTL